MHAYRSSPRATPRCRRSILFFPASTPPFFITPLLRVLRSSLASITTFSLLVRSGVAALLSLDACFPPKRMPSDVSWEPPRDGVVPHIFFSLYRSANSHPASILFLYDQQTSAWTTSQRTSSSHSAPTCRFIPLPPLRPAPITTLLRSGAYAYLLRCHCQATSQ